MNRNAMAGAREQSRRNRQIALGTSASRVEAAGYQANSHRFNAQPKCGAATLKSSIESCSRPRLVVFLPGEVEELEVEKQ
jgi:hypothetical protein